MMTGIELYTGHITLFRSNLRYAKGWPVCTRIQGRRGQYVLICLDGAEPFLATGVSLTRILVYLRIRIVSQVTSFGASNRRKPSIFIQYG